jgi:hypothetical protein
MGRGRQLSGFLERDGKVYFAVDQVERDLGKRLPVESLVPA